MKLVYIADNRCRTNFGCRGTSIALSQLISRDHQIIGSISGVYTHENGGPIFFVPGLPAWNYLLLSKLPGWKFVKMVWVRLIGKRHRLYRFFDFVCDSPTKSIRNFQRCLAVNPHLKEFDISQYGFFDGIVINGEGTMIMTTPPRRDALIYFMFIEWAKLLGKKVYLVNAMFSDCPATGANENTKRTMYEVLKKCTFISTRDPISLDYLKNNFPEIHAEYIPDALFTWQRYIDQIPKINNGRYILPHGQETDADFEQFDFSKPYLCISGSSLAAWDQKSAYTRYKELVEEVKKQIKLPVYLIQACDGDQFLIKVGNDTNTPCLTVQIPVLAAARILSSAALYISGRFHPSILASLGGTPCVFLGSNSHKTWGLQKVVEDHNIIEFSALPSSKEIIEIIVLAKKKLNEGDKLRKRIKTIVSLRSKNSAQLVLS
jgi:polysaccharide pyruvyl transferase WcaK-like protein